MKISNEVFAVLQGIGGVDNHNSHHDASRTNTRANSRDASLNEVVSEDYLQARALLSSFMTRTGSRADLDRARAFFESVTTSDPEFAAGWSGLGIAELQYVRHGFGGQIHVMTATARL